MSNHLAIATVTATLRKLLLNSIQVDLSGAQVTTVNPSASGVPAKGVNIFLYKVSPNLAFSNIDLPTRNRSGVVINKPQVALNLDYHFSFYGNELVLEPQQLLGTTSRVLQSKPQINKTMIDSAITDVTYAASLGGSDLADSVETVKFTPVDMSIEEMSKLWSVYFQTKYALSVVYRASVVLIEGKAVPNPPLPVRDFSVIGFPINKPLIESIQLLANPNDNIVAGSSVQLVGRNLVADGAQMQLEVGGVAVTTNNVTSISTDFTIPNGLTAGTQGAQVFHAFNNGTPPEPHRYMSSNLGVFVLHPFITKINATTYEIAVSTTPDPITSRHTGDVKIKVNPVAKSTQRLTVELIDKGSNQVHTFNSIANNESAAEITFAILDIPVGTYLVRVRVDGAESGFELDNQGLPSKPEISFP